MGYNGFTNYVTWLTSTYVCGIFNVTDINELAYELQAYIEENNSYKNDNGLYADIIRYSIQEINYKQLAEYILNNK